MSENSPETPTDDKAQAPEEAKVEKTFTQEQVNELVARAKQSVRKQYADHDDLKQRAEKAATLEDQVREMQGAYERLSRQATVAKVAAKHGISEEDAELFLTGADSEALERQATRLAALRAPAAPSRLGRMLGRDTKAPSEDLDFVRALFGNA